MHSSWMCAAGWSQSSEPSPKFFRLAQLRKLKSCEHVAAVCFRIRTGAIEFLLVRTRSNGRWTFPKGSAEPGLTHAQAAALEAFEEAGVHGRMEEVSFTRYVRRKGGNSPPKSSNRPGSKPAPTSRKSSEKDPVVNAFLCEVSRLGPPQEADRNPSWFSAEKTKERLRQDRNSDYGAELARVVDRALVRIQRLHRASGVVPEAPRVDGAGLRRSKTKQDALEKVQFIDDAGRTAGLVPSARMNLRIR